MSEQSLDIQQIFHRLSALEAEIRRLREIMRTFFSISPEAKVSDHPYIERVPTVLGGEPVIRGTRTPVRAIVEHWKFGDSPEDIARKMPHLRLAQIFAALSYYDDHREEIEQYIILNKVPVNDQAG